MRTLAAIRQPCRSAYRPDHLPRPKPPIHPFAAFAPDLAALGQSGFDGLAGQIGRNRQASTVGRLPVHPDAGWLDHLGTPAIAAKLRYEGDHLAAAYRE